MSVTGLGEEGGALASREAPAASVLKPWLFWFPFVHLLLISTSPASFLSLPEPPVSLVDMASSNQRANQCSPALLPNSANAPHPRPLGRNLRGLVMVPG